MEKVSFRSIPTKFFGSQLHTFACSFTLFSSCKSVLIPLTASIGEQLTLARVRVVVEARNAGSTSTGLRGQGARIRAIGRTS